MGGLEVSLLYFFSVEEASWARRVCIFWVGKWLFVQITQAIFYNFLVSVLLINSFVGHRPTKEFMIAVG